VEHEAGMDGINPHFYLENVKKPFKRSWSKWKYNIKKNLNKNEDTRTGIERVYLRLKTNDGQCWEK
jgi:hypothetical protein